jgi:hypothetical protein
MNSQERKDYANEFDKIASRINDLSYELTDNKDVKEFLVEMERHRNRLNEAIEIFRKAIS